MNIMNIKDIQEAFNNNYNFSDLITKSREYIEEIVDNRENNFLAETIEESQKRNELKDFVIEYSKTYLIINKCLGENPSFRIAFNFINPESGYPDYVYEIEYNILGEFQDEFFLEV
ncbi:hypothetical protein KYD98_17775 [Clostridium sp. YB-6]|uniref:Uncharacterized protein n=2 Tax=Clostridium weizhouense TaxID=2859781 RepID=A0ABS7AVJ5_9CLOT|nr:hypothetical protein [Clostridium weizhouense]